jgi:hypothetical protein
METRPIGDIDVIALAREIAYRMAPDAVLDSEDIGAMLKCSYRYVRECYAIVPGIPKATNACEMLLEPGTSRSSRVRTSGAEACIRD